MTTFLALYRTLLGAVASRGRVAALGALGAAAVLVGLAVGLSDPVDADRAGVQFVNGLGLSVLVPVIALVFASSAFGDLNDDGTLVYLWLRPLPRWQLATAAFAASLTVTVPLTVLPLCIGAALTGAGGAVVAGAALAVALGVLAYVALFCALGLRVQRALPWGLAYILIWEGFVAQAGRGAGRLAIRAYTRSLLSQAADVRLRLGAESVPTAVIVPIAVAVAAVGYTTFRLGRHDVP
ncbi:MAG: ABC transporter permease [Acidimicrobiales bacterium]|nr:ABC transporter permease [Acidimicrobiales bacterium]